MSYILDALKRAERERKQGKVSVLDEIPMGTASAEPARRLPPVWLPVVVGLVLVALLAYALLARRHHKDTVAATAAPAIPAQAPVQSVTPNSVAPPPPRLAAIAPPDGDAHQAPPQAPAATIEDGTKIATLDDVYGEPPPPPPDQQADQQSGQAPTPGQQMRPTPGPPPDDGARPAGRPQRPPTVTIPVQDFAAAQNAVATSIPGNNAAADNTVAATAAATSDSNSSAPQAQTSAPDQAPQQDQGQQDQEQQRQLREMPENYRANFPSFAVDVHAYNSNPQRRFVLIGGKRYHEGDTMAEGPRIVGIVPEGLVLDWQGQQVLYAIAH